MLSRSRIRGTKSKAQREAEAAIEALTKLHRKEWPCPNRELVEGPKIG